MRGVSFLIIPFSVAIKKISYYVFKNSANVNARKTNGVAQDRLLSMHINAQCINGDA